MHSVPVKLQVPLSVPQYLGGIRRPDQRAARPVQAEAKSKRWLYQRGAGCQRMLFARAQQGEFTEGHELDRKWRVPKEMACLRRKRSGCWRSWNEDHSNATVLASPHLQTI